MKRIQKLEESVRFGGNPSRTKKPPTVRFKDIQLR